MILQLYLCTKISAQSNGEGKEIKAPSKGKKTVTQEEYDEISKKKMAEMRQEFPVVVVGRGYRGGGGRP